MSSLPINAADLIVIAILLLSGLVALVRGFVREFLSLAGWAGAILVTLWGFALLRPHARELIGNPLLADIAAGAALFIVSLIAFSLVAHAIASLVRDSGFSALDRTLGFIFGLARGAVLVALAYLALGWVMPPAEHPPWIKQARALPLVQQAAEFLRGLAPPEFRGQARAAATEIDRRARQVQDAERAMRALSTPSATPPAPAGEPGYKPEDRRGLERLLRSADPPAAGERAR